MGTDDSDGSASDQDPRKARSRARLLDAATTLLVKGGTEAVTIDAVTKLAKVARATLYRHFDSGTELVAAAFGKLVAPAPETDVSGGLREQLVELLTAQARMIEDAPMHITALCWLGMGPALDDYSSASDLEAGDRPGKSRPELRSLREHVVVQYRAAFDRVLGTDEARAALGDFDYDLALAQLVGPLVFTRLATLAPLGPDACVRIVDDFLAARQAGRARDSALVADGPQGEGAQPGVAADAEGT
ncbi:TetR family transcriptional regulator [Prescottella equi]|uniref:TetR/AcrR family transcriptional regulator n=1 Tax=Rhodococcus hoagii TaxID=43767 RepID=UPI000A10720C|nr:TetR/AcrR family transcriptional regulator [Prescottella equi]ORL33842.1 TetR family transcriptional regulator [Prescottella equi]ORL90001.1 TetR family transcriptional regulator [Prescottella equi]ORM19077.1 TetR family transcriptional regulator [Prescottella equi]